MNEIRTALRQLLRNPGFTAVAVLALALGMGVNSVMFSLVDAVLFRPLAVAKPEELVRIGMTDDKGLALGGVSYPQLKDLERGVSSLAGLAGMSGGTEVNLSVGDDAVERVTASQVSGNFFGLLGVAPAAGRLIGPGDDVTPGAHPVAVVSEAFWKRRFARDPGIVGSTVRINTRPFTVVGIAPRGFFGVNLDGVPDLWVPLTMAAEMSPNLAQFKPFERRGFTWVEMIGRLRPGAARETTLAELTTVNTAINQELKLSTEGDRYQRFLVLPLGEALLEPSRRDEVLGSSWLLIGVTGLVLLTACAVAAGLLLVRGEQRQRELAVRLAVGASRARIVRQLLAETLALSAAAAAFGLVLANWSTSIFLSALPAGFPLPLSAATPLLESRVLWFTGAMALLSALGFGLLPAWRVSKPDLALAMKQEAFASSFSPRAFSLRGGFVVLQVALSTVLLVGAGLLLRTMGKASRADLGFDPENALVVSLDVSKSGYDAKRGRQFYAQLLADVRRIPGVRSAALSRHVPVQDPGMITTVTLTGAPVAGREPEVPFTPVSPGFFDTLGVRLEQGRDFTASDEGGPSLLMVNRAFADRFWPGKDALKERVLNFGEKGAAVIGVVADVKQTSVRASREPMIYVPDFDFYAPNTRLLVRTTGDARAVLHGVREAARRLDRNVPLLRVRTLSEHVGLALAQERMIAAMLSAFGLLALTLAAIGLYGVMAYTTQIREREFGIRLALGASPATLLRLVLGQGAALGGIGVVAGLLAASAASRVLQSLLFGVSPTDGVTFLAIAGLLLAVALLASLIPARRAARVDPIKTLRAQ